MSFDINPSAIAADLGVEAPPTGDVETHVVFDDDAGEYPGFAQDSDYEPAEREADIPSEEPPTETVETPEADVNPLESQEQQQDSQHIPRSRLNEEIERRKALENELAQLRQQGLRDQQHAVQVDPQVELQRQIENIKQEIWGKEEVPATVDQNMLSHMAKMQSQIAEMRQAEQQRQVRAIQDQWMSETTAAIAQIKKEHGIEIPEKFILAQILASTGRVKAIDAAQEYAKHILAIKGDTTTVASPRSTTGTRSPEASRKPVPKPKSIDEANKALARELGATNEYDWD